MGVRREKNYQVFLVEDESGVRRSIIGKIRWDALDIQLMGQAQNAEEAYEAIRETPPDIMLLDMRMPGMGGMAFLEILSKQFPSIKIIVLSGYSDFEYTRQALVCGASDYLLKPIIKEDLEAALSKVIRELDQEAAEQKALINQNLLLNQSLPLLKRSMLNKLLQGVHTNTSNLLEKLEIMGISLQYERYVLAIIRVVDFEESKQRYGKNTELLYFAIENVRAETFPAEIPTVGFKSESRENEYICIHGFDVQGEPSDSLQAAYERVAANLEKYSQTKIQVTLSEPFAPITAVHHAYLASSSASHLKRDAESPIVETVCTGQGSWAKLWDAEHTVSLLACVKQNDKKRMIALIQGLFVDAEAEYGEQFQLYQGVDRTYL